jgi:hypothetical protein
MSRSRLMNTVPPQKDSCDYNSLSSYTSKRAERQMAEALIVSLILSFPVAVRAEASSST